MATVLAILIALVLGLQILTPVKPPGPMPAAVKFLRFGYNLQPVLGMQPKN